MSRRKAQTLTIRLRPETKFSLEFTARVRGQSITTVVDRAILAAGDGLAWEQAWEEEKRG